MRLRKPKSAYINSKNASNVALPRTTKFNTKSNSNTKSTEMATFPDDCLPPEGFFESRQALFESINAYAKPRGYAFTTKRSTRERNGFFSVIFACDRSRRLPSSPERDRQRKTTTRITNCPFSVLARESSEGWTLKHRLGQHYVTITTNRAYTYLRTPSTGSSRVHQG